MSLRDYLLRQAANPKQEYKGNGPDPAKQQLLHRQIEEGLVDIGPFPDHSGPVPDLRPKQSGEELGEFLFAKRNGHRSSMPELR